MPPPSLSTTTMRRSAPRPCKRRQRAGVVDEGDVADEGDGRRRRRGRRRARWRRRRRCRWRRGWRGRPPPARRTTRGRGPASTRRRRARRRREAARRRCGRRRARTSGGFGGRGRRRSPPRRRSLRADPAVATTPVAGLHGGQLGESADRGRREGDGDTVVGIDRRRARRPARAVAAPTAIHWASTFDAAGRPMRTTTSGRCAAANSLDAQDGVEGGDGTGEVTAARRRVGEHRPAGRRRPALRRPSAARRCGRRRGSTRARCSSSSAMPTSGTRPVADGRRHGHDRARRQLARPHRGAARGTAG